MADTLKAKIQLEGGDEVARQFKAIGQSGRDAFAQASSAAATATQSIGRANSILTDLASGFRQAVQSMSGAGSAMGRAFDPFVAAAKGALDAAAKTGAGLGAIAGGAAAISAALGKIGQDSANAVAKLHDAAAAVGLTVDKYNDLRAALQGVGIEGNALDSLVSSADKAARGAEVNGKPSRFRRAPQTEGGGEESASPAEAISGWRAASKDNDVELPLSGIADQAESVKTSVLGAEREISNLPKVYTAVNGELKQISGGLKGGNGSGGFAEAANELGVSLRDMYGKARPGIEIIRDLVLALSQMEDGSRRTDLSVRAFGEAQGQNAIKIADNREVVEQLAASHAKAAANFTEGQIKSADEARRTGAVLSSVKAQWIEYFRSLATPVTVDRNNALISFLQNNKEAIRGFGDSVVAPVVQWLGRLDHAFGITAIAAGALGVAFGGIGAGAGVALAAAGVAAVAFGSRLKDTALAAMAEVRQIVGRFDLSTFDGWRSAARTAFADMAESAKGALAQLRQTVASIDWGEVWATFTSITGSALRALGSVALDAFETIKAGAQAVLPALAAPWANFVGMAANAFGSVGDISLGTWAAIGAGLAAAILIWRGNFIALTLGVAPFWEEILSGAARLAPGLARYLTPVYAALDGLLGGLRAMWSNFWRALYSPSAGGIAPSSAESAEVFAGMRTAATVAWARIKQIFSAGVQALRTVIEEALPGTQRFFNGLGLSARALGTAITVLGAEFGGFLALLSLGQIRLNAWESILLLVGLRVTGLLPIFGHVVGFLGFAINGIGHLFTGLVTLITSLVVPAFLALGRAAVTAFLFMAANPVTAIVAAMALIGGAIYLLMRDWDNLAEKDRSVFGVIREELHKTADDWREFTRSIGETVDWVNGKVDKLAEKIGDFKQLIGLDRGTGPGGPEAAPTFTRADQGTGGAAAAGGATLGSSQEWEQSKRAVFGSLDQIDRKGSDTWTDLKEKAAKSLGDMAILPAWGKLKDNWKGIFDGVQSLDKGPTALSKLFDDLIGKSKTVGTSIKDAATASDQAAQKIAHAKRRAADAFRQISGDRPDNFRQAPDGSRASPNLPHESDDEAAQRDRVNSQFGQDVLGAPAGKAAKSIEELDTQAQDAGNAVKSVVDSFSGFRDAAAAAVSGLEKLGDAARAATGKGDKSGDKGADAPGFAGGGLLSGAGTGTSDSMLARVSNGEYIQTARATRGWGTPFMDAVKSLDLRGVLSALGGAFGDTLPAFALGGSVGHSMTPAFSTGNSFSPMRHAGVIAFTLPVDGKEYELMGHKDIVRQMQRDSIIKRVSSANKVKSSWDRG
jgi:hypothetical protein